MTTCTYCSREVDPRSPSTYRRILGWERKAISASRRGGSDVALREHRCEWAHGSCIDRERMGVAPGQTELIA